MLWGSLAIVFLAVLSPAVRADEKYYVWTYDYSSLAKGNSEIEYYLTATTKDRQTSGRSDWEHQVELEYGITDHLDAGLYQVFAQQAGDSLQYAGFKFRLRYRVAEKNQLPVDIVFYAEHKESTLGESLFEGKVFLAKDFGKLNIAYNQIYERGYSSGKGEYEYAVGASYELKPWLRMGVESKGSYSEGEYAAGPTISWVGDRIWGNLGILYGLNRLTDDRSVRLLLGIPF